MLDRMAEINEPEGIGSRLHRPRALLPKIDTALAAPALGRSVATMAVSIFLSPTRARTPTWGGRQIDRIIMTVAALSTTSPTLFLASSLFEQVSSLTAAPTDGVYADCLISLAFGHLHAALNNDLSGDVDALNSSADRIENCDWLSTAVSTHVARTLRAAASGLIPPRLALEIVQAASHRTSHQMLIDCARATGSDGLGALTDAVADRSNTVRH